MASMRRKNCQLSWGRSSRGEAEAVFGSRMIDKRAARAGGMPLYKWVGNQVLTSFQNRMLGTGLSEFHSGYRLYSTERPRPGPVRKEHATTFISTPRSSSNSCLKKLRIAELPIPTFYGDEICHVNGMRYAWDVFKATHEGASL